MRKSLFFISILILLCKSALASETLVPMESKKTNFTEQEMHKTREVLISTETKMPALNFVIRQEEDRSSGILISWENTGLTGSFIVRRETDKTGGVLVNKPDPLDMKVLNIIDNENMNSLEDYAKWLKKNFEYKKDESADIWSSPEETLTKKYGDCEDFAFLNAAVLRVFGYRPKVLGIVGGMIGVNHAICVFEKDGYYLWFDNTKLKKTSTSSIEEFGRYIFKKYLCFAIYEVDLYENNRNTLSGSL